MRLIGVRLIGGSSARGLSVRGSSAWASVGIKEFIRAGFSSTRTIVGMRAGHRRSSAKEDLNSGAGAVSGGRMLLLEMSANCRISKENYQKEVLLDEPIES